jgi:hypothetical protein
MTPDTLTVRRFTIPAGETGIRLPITGSMFQLLDCGQPLTVRIVRQSLTEEIDMVQGQGRRVSPDDPFLMLDFRRHPDFASTALPLRFNIVYGTGEFTDFRSIAPVSTTMGFSEASQIYFASVITREAASEVRGVVLSGGTIAAAGTVVLNGTPPTGFVSRKSALVCNDDPANFLTISDGTVASCRVYPRTAVRIDTTGPLTVRNDTASAIACTVSEIWNR